ncbi:hypothetical protein B9Z55_007002 [Caenorhabditis nigoni]|uniref:F-box associated domain-containing protein n=1 Tax=Caenorhabditis nigoni TaxID=1611254 RepID=A0A2G5V7Y2_9PELO|nr:hypothetical protein B9Z55_007002 [Caenorhabditis nigoni]
MPVVSYPALRSIIEHMEANCRLSLSARCPEISRSDKSIPLRVNEIHFVGDTVTINNVDYKIFSKINQIVRRKKDSPCVELTLKAYDSKSKCSIEKIVWVNHGVEVGTRKIVEYLLGGRNNIRVKRLAVYSHNIMQYLIGLSNMKVGVFQYDGNGLSEFHQLIENLKELHLVVSHPTDLETPIVRKAEKIVIKSYGYDEPDIWLETHRNLLNKEVKIDTCIRGLTDISVMELIEHWRATCRAVGSSFSVRKLTDSEDFIETFLENAKERFQGTYVKLKQADKRKVTDTNAVSIKIDSRSRIVVYESGPFRGFPAISIVMIKVMAVESSEEISELIL